MKHAFIVLPDKDNVQRVRNAALFTSDEWKRISSHRAWDAEDQKETLRRLRRDEYTKTTSQEITKDWEDTVENIQKRRKQKLADFKMAAAKEKLYKYNIMMEKQRQDKRDHIEQIRKILFTRTDSVKELNSSLLLSEVLRERKAQIEFSKRISEKEKKKEVIAHQRMLEDLEKFKEERNEEKELEKQKKMLNKETLLEQIEENKSRREDTKWQEAEDLQIIIEQNKLMDQREKEEAKLKKQQIKLMYENQIEEKKEFKERRRKEDEEDERIITEVGNIKKKLLAERNMIEQEASMAIQWRKEYVVQLMADRPSAEDNEKERLEKAVEERERKEEERRQKENAFRQKLVRELQEVKKQYDEKERREKVEKEQWKRLEMRERFKQDALYKKHLEELRQEKMEEGRNYRAHHMEQMALREKILQEERETDINAKVTSSQLIYDDDEAILKYADEVILESKKKNRPILPLLRVVEKFKRDRGFIKPKAAAGLPSSQIPFGPGRTVFEPTSQEDCLCKDFEKNKISKDVKKK